MWAGRYAIPARPQDGGVVRNRLFIPETRCCRDCGVRAMYAFGEHDALGFSPFAIDQASADETDNITKAYNLLRQVSNLKPADRKNSWGLLFDQEDTERIIDDEGTVMTCRHYYTLPWDPRATDGTHASVPMTGRSCTSNSTNIDRVTQRGRFPMCHVDVTFCSTDKGTIKKNNYLCTS